MKADGVPCEAIACRNMEEGQLIAGHFSWCHLSTVTMEQAADLGWDTACDCWVYQRFQNNLINEMGIGMQTEPDVDAPKATIIKQFSPTLLLLRNVEWRWGWEPVDVIGEMIECLEGEPALQMELIRKSNTKTGWELNLGPFCLRRRPELHYIL